MANIRELLNNIKYAIFGKEIRQSIHDAIEECYNAASINHDNANMEVSLARGIFKTLNDRFNKNEADIKNNSLQLGKKALQSDLIIERNRIDLLTKIQNEETEGNTELLDIRAAADGIVYSTAGESVRNQFKDRLNKLIELNSIITFEPGIYEVNGTKVDSSTRIRSNNIIKMSAGDKIVNKNKSLVKYCVIDYDTHEVIVNLGSSSDGYEFLENKNILIYFGYTDNRVIGSNYEDIINNIILYGGNGINKRFINDTKKEYLNIVEDDVELEVLDLRKDEDGNVYNSAGESIRKQVGTRISKEFLINGILTYEKGIFSIDGNKEDANNRCRIAQLIKFNKGDYIINKNNKLIKYCIVDKNDKTIYVNLGSSSAGYVFTKECTVFIYGGYVDNREFDDNSDFINNLLIYSKNGVTDEIGNIIAKKYLVDLQNRYNNLIWCIMGDSLSDTNNSYANKRYFDYIAEDLGIQKSNITNLAVSGSGYKRTNSNFMTRVDKIPINSNLITIFGSLNDCNSNVNYDFGTATDTGTDTLGGCINTTIDLIINRCPLAKIIIFSPTPWSIYKNSDKDNRAWKYINLLKEICELRNIKFKDLYTTSNLFPWDSRHNLFFYENNETNNVHPNSNGHKMFYPSMRETIKEVY